MINFYFYAFFSLPSQNINSAEQCFFNSQYQPLSKLISSNITENSTRKHDIEELIIETQNDSMYIFLYDNIHIILRKLKRKTFFNRKAYKN
jgi:hypothetical protein